jgi:hypothetical protein
MQKHLCRCVGALPAPAHQARDTWRPSLTAAAAAMLFIPRSTCIGVVKSQQPSSIVSCHRPEFACPSGRSGGLVCSPAGTKPSSAKCLPSGPHSCFCCFDAFTRAQQHVAHFVKSQLVVTLNRPEYACMHWPIWRSRVLSCRHQSIKRQVPAFRRSQLLLRALAAWRGITAAKLQQEQRRRQAVRHHYLSVLARGVAAWREALQAASVRQGLLQLAAQQRNRQLLQRAWQVSYKRLLTMLLL